MYWWWSLLMFYFIASGDGTLLVDEDMVNELLESMSTNNIRLYSWIKKPSTFVVSDYDLRLNTSP